MSQPASDTGFSADGSTNQTQSISRDESIQGRQNGRKSTDIISEAPKADLSNGFENHSNQIRPQKIQSGMETHINQPKQAVAKNQIQPVQQSQQKRAEERPSSVPVLVTHQPYHDNIVIDRLQFLPQGGAQPIPVHAAQFAPEYIIAAPGDPLQYSQIHGTLYNPNPGQYVSRDLNMRDSGLYTPNLALATGSSPYVQQVTQPQIPSQSTTGQQPYNYNNKGLQLPPSVATGYVHFAPQIHYNQYPQTVVNASPYNSQQNIYSQQYNQQQLQQPSSAQHSPNPQRFSQELTQYQGQPIIQPIAQNIAHTVTSSNNERSSSRGPKPMVPPRINSKITTDPGHHKPVIVDVSTGQKAKIIENNALEVQEQINAGSDDQDLHYVMAINQNPRTRQDGLYIETNGDSSREQTVGTDNGNADCGIYVSRSDRRKSVSADVTSNFSRRNDPISFAFPGDNSIQQESILINNRSPINSINVGDNKSVEVNTSNFPSDQRRFDVNSGLRMSPMPILPPLSVLPKGMMVGGDRKSVEWSNLSSNQRIVIPQDNRRSEYLEEHRRSPMTIDGKRFEEIRRSPMAFVPIRDTNTTADHINQKSPNNLVNQNLEKTRTDLAMWKEQRQRQEIENKIIQNREMFSTSPRSRNPSEERRPENRISAFQPIAISQSSIMEQRRHLRHVSADLTKHMELSRKEFDDQQVTGSVVNLGTSTTTCTTNVMSRASPKVCYQHPMLNEMKLDSKTISTAADINETSMKSKEHVDHIIHSHRKSQNLPTSMNSKSQENTQNQSEQINDKTDAQQSQSTQLMHNKQSIEFISEKLSQCERQQSNLQAKLQSLQSQNDILDKVTQFQFQQNDIQTRIHNLQLQNHIAEKLSQQHSSEFSQTGNLDDPDETNKSILNQCINASRQLYQQSLLTTTPQLHSSSYFNSDRISPRLHFPHHTQDESDLNNCIQIPNISQMPLPNLSQFDRADMLPRCSLSQLHRAQSSNDNFENVPCSQMSLASLSTLNFTGTLKKIPPEKPPRTSLIAQSPESESNRSQPAIGLKHTSKARDKESEEKL